MVEKMEYKFHVIFNSAQQSRKKPTDDTRLASTFVQLLMDKMKSYEIKGYNPDTDAMLGSSIFDQQKKIIDETEWTLVIVTPTFFNDCRGKFKGELAFDRLIKGDRRHKLIPIAVGTTDLQEFAVNEPLIFDDDENSWRESGDWERLRNTLRGTHENNRRTSSNENQAIDDNRLRTDRQNLVVHPVSEASSISPLSENTQEQRNDGEESGSNEVIQQNELELDTSIDTTTDGASGFGGYQAPTQTRGILLYKRNGDGESVSNEVIQQNELESNTSEPAANGASGYRGISLSSAVRWGGHIVNFAGRAMPLIVSFIVAYAAVLGRRGGERPFWVEVILTFWQSLRENAGVVGDNPP